MIKIQTSEKFYAASKETSSPHPREVPHPNFDDDEIKINNEKTQILKKILRILPPSEK